MLEDYAEKRTTKSCIYKNVPESIRVSFTDQVRAHVGGTDKTDKSNMTQTITAHVAYLYLYVQ